jgi:hypothetical protein
MQHPQMARRSSQGRRTGTTISMINAEEHNGSVRYRVALIDFGLSRLEVSDNVNGTPSEIGFPSNDLTHSFDTEHLYQPTDTLSNTNDFNQSLDLVVLLSSMYPEFTENPQMLELKEFVDTQIIEAAQEKGIDIDRQISLFQNFYSNAVGFEFDQCTPVKLLQRLNSLIPTPLLPPLQRFSRELEMGFLYKLRNNGDEFDVRINRAAEFWLSQIEEMRTLRLDEAHLAAELFDAVVKSLEEKEPVDLIFLRALFNKVEEVTASINNSSPIDRIIMTLSKQQMRQIIKDIDND